LHGHNFQILATGYGTWDGVITNPSNPTRRDVAMLERAKQTSKGIIPAYTVIQFFTDNPGLWPMHCHVAWHNSAGLFVNILTRPEDVQKEPVPEVIEQTCTQWKLYTSSAAYDTNDMGAGI
jgi:FtsP/CotA-like multicopper oxidase with cupredoxin domain